MSRHSFLLCDRKLCPTCRGHNLFVLTQIWACEVSLESSLNVECNHGRFEPFDALDDTEKIIFSMMHYETSV